MAPGLTDRSPPGPPLPDLSPEARRKEALRHKAGLTEEVTRRVGPGSRAHEVGSRVLLGAWNDGFIHAGNLAYMAVLAIFPFFITGAALFSLIGEEGERSAAINTILIALPPVVGSVIGPVARGVIAQSSGTLLWIGGLVGCHPGSLSARWCW
jgi:membrane protein